MFLKTLGNTKIAIPIATAPQFAPQNHQTGEMAEPNESHAGLYDQQGQLQETPRNSPIDIEAIVRSVIGSWKLIGIMAIIGAIFAGIYAKSLPNEYQAWAELSINPGDLKVIDSQLTPTGFGGEAMIANLESQLRIIESSSVLNKVIVSERLLDDPEFTGRGGTSFGLMDMIFPPSRGLEELNAHQRVLEKLQDTLSISRGNRTFIVAVGITTQDPEKSARIANAVTQAYIEGEISARSKIARNTSANLEDRLAKLRKNVLDAELAVENYKAENGLISSGGKLTTEVQLSRLNEQLANAKIDTINSQARMEQARATDLSDVVSGIVPAGLNSNTISSLQVRYSALKSNADKLATKLGVKHPQRIEAEAELASSKRQISKEIRRLINGASKDFERATKRQKNLKQQVTSLEANASGVGASLIQLRELEQTLLTHKQVRDNYLLRARETGEQEGITTTNIRRISEATPPLQKIGPRRKIIAGIGFVLGAILGMLLALFMGILGAIGPIKPRDQSPDNTAETPNYNEGDAAVRDGYGSRNPHGQYPQHQAPLNRPPYHQYR